MFLKQKIRVSSIIAIALSIVGIAVAAVLCYAAYRDDICFDSAILLVEMERIAGGYIPYSTIHLNYPPLWFYLMAGMKFLFHVPYGCYNFYFAVNLVMLFVCGNFFFRIARKIGGSVLVSTLATWLYIISSLMMGGTNVLFEVPSIMFGLAGLYFSLLFLGKDCRHYLWIGAVLCCSFLIKQFGLGFIALSSYLVVVEGSKDKWMKLLYLVVGFIIPFILVILLFGRSFIDAVFLNDYSSHLEASLADRLHNMSHMLRSFARRMPLILAALLLFPALITQGRWKESLFLACGILGFSLQFLFMVDASHYFLYILPFTFLLLPLLSSLKLTPSEKFVICVSCFFLMYVNFVPLANTTKIRINAKSREVQRAGVNMICNGIPNGAKVWIADTNALPLYYFLDLNTPNVEKYGYCATSMQISTKMAGDQIAGADYVICSEKDCSEYSKDIFFVPELREKVINHEKGVIKYFGRTYYLCDMSKDAVVSE